MKHTFEYFPIETAPKNREIMIFARGAWISARWHERRKYERYPSGWWHGGLTVSKPTHWAEIEAMKPGGAE